MTTPFEDIVKENKKLNKVIDAMEINRKELEKPNYDNAAFQDTLLDRIQELEQQIKDIRNEVLGEVESGVNKLYKVNTTSMEEVNPSDKISFGLFFMQNQELLKVKEIITKLRQKETQQGERK